MARLVYRWLNYQIEHHWFTKICYVNYSDIARTVKQTAAKFGLAYLEKLILLIALEAHIVGLKRFGTQVLGSDSINMPDHNPTFRNEQAYCDGD
ncbi:hypothetical protein [Dyadobacter sp. CY347]|uniref:hypothetical protein n=1 Tax=Dyadobacter sp. CY347 TaxID=2909336 RepID=UPI001F16448C|nr:hypothetical protein [Dyadobacter sp. CY347]MCF2488076.1 hypothetical protein [Dyadobacter sp. CY347]